MLQDTPYSFIDFTRSAAPNVGVSFAFSYMDKSEANNEQSVMVSRMYRDYIKWLVAEKKKFQTADNCLSTVTVSELIYQIQMINAYAHHELQKRKRKSNYDVISEHMETPIDHSDEVNKIVAEHFKKVDSRVYNAVTKASKESFTLDVNMITLAFLMFGSLLFGFSFVAKPSIVVPALLYLGTALLLVGFAASLVRFFASTKTPEISFFGYPLYTNRSSAMKSEQRYAMWDTVLVKQLPHSPGWDERNPIIRTSRIIRGTVLALPLHNTLNQPILSTVASLTEARFSPFYQAGVSNGTQLKKDNGNAKQIIDLDVLSNSQSNPHFNQRIDKICTQLMTLTL